MNYVIIAGRLCKEVEAGGEVARFVLAVEDKKQTEIIPCVAFGKNAELLTKYHKGEKIGIAGKIRTEQYEKDGAKHYATMVIAESIEAA